MSSNYFGEPYPGNERSGGSSSSRKGKKTNTNTSSSENKPKHPQRGLGVAQLEKIRIHSQMASTLSQEGMRMQPGYPPSLPYASSSPLPSPSSTSPPYGFPGHQNIMVGLPELQGTNIRYVDSQPSPTPGWNPGSGMLEIQQYAPPSMTRHFLNPQAEDSVQTRRNRSRSEANGAGNQNSQTSDTQELDLELRL